MKKLMLLAALLAAAPTLAQDAKQKVIAAALDQVGRTRYYDSSYRQLAYPNGDVPIERGVCSDVVIRAFRAAGLDLQVLVHEDMVRNFAAYPHKWRLTRPDKNIDHRRVPNLATFFTRRGKAREVTRRGADYIPGDIVTWDLGGGVPHIGIVSDRRAAGSDRYLVVHNIGSGAQAEDVLFSWQLTGHFRYF